MILILLFYRAKLEYYVMSEPIQLLDKLESIFGLSSENGNFNLLYFL